MDKNSIVAVVAIQNWLPNVYVLFGLKGLPKKDSVNKSIC
jgi:hypothetical protein